MFFITTNSLSIICHQRNIPEFVGSTTESKKAKTKANLTDTPTKAPSTDPPVAPVESFTTITPNGCPTDKPPAFVGCAEGIDGKKGC